jgi:hypothetical protein
MPDRTLSDSCFSHIVSAPIDHVDISDWLFHLTSAEYQRCCPPAHIAAGTNTGEDGRPISINIEVIGDSLIIHQYVGEVTEPHHCLMVSTSDVFNPQGRTTSHVVWDLSVEPLDAQSCEYVNRITATATDEFIAFIAEHGVPFAEAACAVDKASAAHNEQETPLLAHSIERRALHSSARGNQPASSTD